VVVLVIVVVNMTVVSGGQVARVLLFNSTGVVVVVVVVLVLVVVVAVVVVVIFVVVVAVLIVVVVNMTVVSGDQVARVLLFNSTGDRKPQLLMSSLLVNVLFFIAITSCINYMQLSLALMPSSHRLHGQDKTLLSCLCRWC